MVTIFISYKNVGCRESRGEEANGAAPKKRIIYRRCTCWQTRCLSGRVSRSLGITEPPGLMIAEQLFTIVHLSSNKKRKRHERGIIAFPSRMNYEKGAKREEEEEGKMYQYQRNCRHCSSTIYGNASRELIETAINIKPNQCVCLPSRDTKTS